VTLDKVHGITEREDVFGSAPPSRDGQRANGVAAYPELLQSGRVRAMSSAWCAKYLLRNLGTMLPLAIGDQLALAAAATLVAWAIPAAVSASATISGGYNRYLAGALLVTFAMGRLYPGVGLRRRDEARQAIRAIVLLFVLLGLTASLAGGSQAVVLAVWAATCALCLTFVILFRYVIRRVCCRFGWWTQPVVIFADGGRGDAGALARCILAHPYIGLSPVGIVGGAPRPVNRFADSRDVRLDLAATDAAKELLRTRSVYRAIVAPAERSDAEFQQLLKTTSENFPHVLVLSRIRNQGLPLQRGAAWNLDEYSGFELRNRLLAPTSCLVKRGLDLCVSAVVGVLTMPLVLVITCVIKWTSPGPVFFAQERLGRHGRRFRIWKFRTMLVNAEQVLEDYLQQHPELRKQWETTHKLTDDPRIVPRVGHFLRKSSLDELPQLWNVFKGEMSLVGPRPLPPYHLEQFDQRFRHYREQVRPGITGLWQVASRGDGPPENYIHWDSSYIRDWSLWLDVTILIRTVQAVLAARGAC
jgi:Undecaprenyl-phosphate galactose phosphotransferase WbaP